MVRSENENGLVNHDEGYFEESNDLDEEQLCLEVMVPGNHLEQVAAWNKFLQFLAINKEAEDIQFSDFENKTFVSIDQAESFYMLYSKMMGFSVRKRAKRRDIKGNVTVRSWVCSCSGLRENKNCIIENRDREIRGLTRTGCKVAFRINLNKKLDSWSVKCFDTHHNHRLALSFEKPFLRSNRKISDSDREQALSMKRAGVKTYQIFNYQAELNDGWENVGFLKPDLYRGIAKNYSSWDGSDVNTAIRLLEARKVPDPKFFYKYETDEENRLTNVFWSDCSSQVDYKLFGDCLSFDATYKTNRYGKPLVLLLGSNNHDKTCIFGAALLQNESGDTYIWLLQTFLECMDGKMPKTVLTDGCKSMNKGLETIMPGIPHRICSWHILKNAKSHIKAKGFKTDLRRMIFRYYGESEWEQEWKEILEKYDLAGNLWMEAQYLTREQWAETFLRGNYFGGSTATVRCESMNSFLKKDLENKLPLWMFFKYFDFALSQLDYKEKKEHFRSTMTQPLPGQTSMPSLEEEVSSIFTREIFLRIKREMQRAEKYILTIDDGLFADQTVCYVKVYGGSGVKRQVMISNDRETVQCSCYLFETKGIPCRHIFISLKYLEIMTMPLCLVNRRWLKDAKDVEQLSFGRENKGAHPEAAAHWRYGMLTKQASLTAFLASKSQQAFEKAAKVITELNEELVNIFPVKELEKLQDDDEKIGDAVLDSNICKTKGRQTPAAAAKSKQLAIAAKAKQLASVEKSKQVASSSKANSSGLNKRKRETPNRCRICKQTGHDFRNCKLKDQCVTKENAK